MKYDKWIVSLMGGILIGIWSLDSFGSKLTILGVIGASFIPFFVILGIIEIKGWLKNKSKQEFIPIKDQWGR